MTYAYAIADRSDPEGPYPTGWVFGLNMALRAELFQAGWRFDSTVRPDGTATHMTGGESELLLRLGRARLRGMVHEGRRRARGSRGDAVSGAAAHVVGGLPDPPGGQGPATQTP